MGLAEWFKQTFTSEDDAPLQINLSPAPKPRLVRVRRAPGRDEWHAWRDSPVTEFVMAAITRRAEEHADRWHQLSWVGGNADQRQLDALRERSDALKDISEADYEGFCEALQLEPEALQNAG